MFLYRVRQRSVKEGGEPRAGRGGSVDGMFEFEETFEISNFFIKLLHFPFGLGSFEFGLVFNFSRRGELGHDCQRYNKSLVWMRVAQVA